MNSQAAQLPRPSEQSFAILGAGRVGISLGFLLERAGCSVTGCFARSESSKALAAKWLSAPVRQTINEAARDADCLLLTVPDSAVASVSTELSENRAVRAGTFVLHTAGAFGVVPLQPAAEAGAHAIAFHPLQAVPNVESGTAHIPGSWVGVTSTRELFGWAESLAAVIGCTAFEVPEEMRPLYHAAATISSNYLVTLSWLVQQTFSNAEPFFPLMRGTLDNVEQQGPELALTGAIVRGDVETVERHLESLQREARDIAPHYRELGKATLELAARSGRIDGPKHQRIAAVLESQP